MRGSIPRAAEGVTTWSGRDDKSSERLAHGLSRETIGYLVTAVKTKMAAKRPSNFNPFSRGFPHLKTPCLSADHGIPHVSCWALFNLGEARRGEVHYCIITRLDTPWLIRRGVEIFVTNAY